MSGGADGGAPAESPLPDLRIEVHECELDGPLLARAQRERLHCWAEVDLLGLGELSLRSARVAVPAQQGRVGVALRESVPVEPDEAIWAPLREALASEDEQDSDVYFVVRLASGIEHEPEEVQPIHFNIVLASLAAATEWERCLVLLEHDMPRSGLGLGCGTGQTRTPQPDPDPNPNPIAVRASRPTPTRTARRSRRAPRRGPHSPAMRSLSSSTCALPASSPT